MSLTRVLATTHVTLTNVFKSDGDPVDSSTTVTATVKRFDGTQIVGSPFTCSHPGTGTYTFPLPGRADVDALTVDWSGTVAGAAITTRDDVEGVGGFYFGLDEAAEAVRSAALRAPQTYTDAYLASKRIGVEQEADLLSGQAWVPRFRRVQLNGGGVSELVLPDRVLRRVRAVSVRSEAGGAFVAWTQSQLDAIAPDAAGILAPDDGTVFPDLHGNVIVEYEHGADYPPVEIRDAALLRLKMFVNRQNTSTPDRVLYQTNDQGTTFRMTIAGPRSTGVPDIDAAYLRDAVPDVWLAR